MPRIFGSLAALFGLLGVAGGAFGAHAMEDLFSAYALEVFETGMRYQMVHALALLAVALLASRGPGKVTAAAGWCFVAGIVVFSGSLTILALSGARWWGAITPIGGVAFMAGWLLLMVAFARMGRE